MANPEPFSTKLATPGSSAELGSLALVDEQDGACYELELDMDVADVMGSADDGKSAIGGYEMDIGGYEMEIDDLLGDEPSMDVSAATSTC